MVINTSKHFNRSEAFIVKDYFATMMLREATEAYPQLVFKGGTSLSKCYGIIARFSEDIDLGIPDNHATEGARKNIKRAVVKAACNTSLEILNLNAIRSRRDYNRYELAIPLSSCSGKDSIIIVETALMTPASPFQERSLCSFIGEYCATAGFYRAIEEYALDEFLVKATSLERTFCDKVFAVCDYYLLGDTPHRQSRHIYDLRKLQTAISFDNALRSLVETVRTQRAGRHHCPSADPSVDIPSVLDEIVSCEFYRKDYESTTVPLLYEDMPYQEAVSSLSDIARFLSPDNHASGKLSEWER